VIDYGQELRQVQRLRVSHRLDRGRVPVCLPRSAKVVWVLGSQSEIHDPEGLVAGLVEFFGGSLVALGFGARTAAFLASGEMAVAYFKAHAPRGFWPILNGGERAVLYCFFFLYVTAYGPGRMALEFVLQKLRRRGEP